MADISQVKLPNGDTYNLVDETSGYITTSIYSGTCASAAADTTKIVACSDFTDLKAGAAILVTFNATNTAAVGDLTLNVNNTGAKKIQYINNGTRGNLSSAGYLKASTTYLFVYDGTYWVAYFNYNTTYSSMTDAEITAGTGTTARTITPARLKTAVETWAPVTSVNGQTGAVTIAVPSNTSDLTNDSGYITSQYIENKTDYSIPVSRVGEIEVGETAIGTDSTNFPTSKAVVDYVDERVVQEMDAIDVGVTGIKANGTSLAIENGIVNIPVVGLNQSVGLITEGILNDIHNQIPTSTSQLTNDSGFITSYKDEKVKQESISSNNSSYKPVLLAYKSDGITSTNYVNQNIAFCYQSSTQTLSGVKKLDGDGFTTTLPNKSGTVALTSDIPDTSSFLTSETDPVFSASAAAGITSTDISNWNAKVSDDKTWNGVELNNTTMSGSNLYMIGRTSTSETNAYNLQATNQPAQSTLAMYDSNRYLKSTTPSANDNSTKVATTAYVDSAIPDTSRFIPTTTNATSIDARDGFTLYQYDNTSTGGFRRLSLGNEINYKTSGGAYGVIRFYDSGQYYRGDLLPNLNLTSDQTWTLPNATGTIALTSDIPQVYSSTNTGGYLTMATLPIYDGTVE